MSITATAGLAEISQSYLSVIELGQCPVAKRVVLEGLARPLRVRGQPADQRQPRLRAWPSQGYAKITFCVNRSL